MGEHRRARARRAGADHLEAVAARALSALQPERVAASAELVRAPTAPTPSALPPLDAYRDALLGAKICAYAQGFAVLAAARDHYGWALDLGAAARVWQGGCIIRARLLGDIEAAYAAPPARSICCACRRSARA